MSAGHSDAVDLLFAHIAALPHPEYGHINMLPFAYESDQVRKIKRDVCQAIIDLLDGHGYMKAPTAEQLPPRISTRVRCVECGVELFSISLDENGVANMNPRNVIQTVSQINPDCASGHAQLTVDDLRQHIEREFYADPETRKSMVCPVCDAAPGDWCRKVKDHQVHNGLHDERGVAVE